jgi:hypothetical protein
LSFSAFLGLFNKPRPIFFVDFLEEVAMKIMIAVSLGSPISFFALRENVQSIVKVLGNIAVMTPMGIRIEMIVALMMKVAKFHVVVLLLKSVALAQKPTSHVMTMMTAAMRSVSRKLKLASPSARHRTVPVKLLKTVVLLSPAIHNQGVVDCARASF